MPPHTTPADGPSSGAPALLPGAEPWSRPPRPREGEPRVGVLVQHGFTGQPAAMKPWAEELSARGWAVEVPRLPGHGTTWQDCNTTGWDDWCAEVLAAHDRLRATCDVVVAAGLSMGGALVLRLAADRPDAVDGVVLVNPAVATHRKDVLALPLLQHVVGSFPGIAGDIAKPGVSEQGYDRTPLRAAASMMRGWAGVRRDLGRVTAPVLYLRSDVDHVVDEASEPIITAGVAGPVTRVALPDSFHVATIDHDLPRIVSSSIEFVEGLPSVRTQRLG
ncbi:alpha/beta hydrolase [Nocardioides bruguierae]|uniref:Alpha/beta fold hydrolase n=1 Tax=Nocardioides bruguierae TaxID=2945102 RepID=A0A9X2IHC7_9ACTN|nr:alpha/beta fold hydrolase [Nocardioides bruguierae]MCM0621655.1 alpha/beta fold hydrolase [Nocardioides bruguierae]